MSGRLGGVRDLIEAVLSEPADALATNGIRAAALAPGDQIRGCNAVARQNPALPVEVLRCEDRGAELIGPILPDSCRVAVKNDMDSSLAYCGFGVSDVEAWTSFAVDQLGLMRAGQGDPPHLRIDDRSWRIALHHSPKDDLLYAGFEIEDEEQLEKLRVKLLGSAIEVFDLSQTDCDQRKVQHGFHFADPNSVRLEFVTGHAKADTPFQSDKSRGFVTGDQGLGHIVLAVADLEQTISFYEQQLGMRVSDYITVPMGDAKLRIAFLHCNPRHHSVAFAVMPGKRLNHLMIEARAVDDVILSHRRCVDAGLKTGEIGRHPNDLMLSYYVTTPAGFDLEFGWGGRMIEGDWTVAEYDQISLWGHQKT